MDIVEHYLDKSLITSLEHEDILCELALHDLFKRDNKQRFIDKVEADEMLDAKNNPLKVKSGTKSLWKQMKKELLNADSHKDLVGWGGNTKDNKIKQLFA